MAGSASVNPKVVKYNRGLYTGGYVVVETSARSGLFFRRSQERVKSEIFLSEDL